MAATNLKQQEADYLESIRLAVKSREPGLAALVQLLQSRLQRADRELRQCQLPDFPAQQARAQVYAQLLKEFTE